MFTRLRREGARVGALVALTCVAAASMQIGCGSDADETGGGERTAPAETTAVPIDDPVVRGGDRAMIREVIDDVQDSLFEDRPVGICFELVDGQLERLMSAIDDPDATCEDAVAASLERHADARGEPVRSEIDSIELDGEPREGQEAIAIVRDPGGAPYRVRFVRQRSQWKLARFAPWRASGLGPDGRGG